MTNLRNGMWVRVRATSQSMPEVEVALQKYPAVIQQMFTDMLTEGCTAIYLREGTSMRRNADGESYRAITPAQVHVVDMNDGSTLFELPASVVQITGQCSVNDIPAPRRPEPAVAAKLGYA